MGAGSNRHGYKAGDLVLYNGNKNAGLVLQVHEDYLKMINEQSKIVKIPKKKKRDHVELPRNNRLIAQKQSMRILNPKIVETTRSSVWERIVNAVLRYDDFRQFH